MNSLLSQGLSLTLYGMGTVLIFLFLLILVTRCMSSIILSMEKRSQSAATGAAGPLVRQQASQGSQGDERRLRVVIAAAIRQYRDTHG